jgi:hypothetical protein
MEKKMFAIKLDSREKEAMDYVSGVTGSTLSSLHAPALRRRAMRNLGYVLLHGIHGEVPDEEDIGLFIRDEKQAFHRHTPMVILNLVTLMGEGPTHSEFTRIFPRMETEAPSSFIQGVDMGHLAEEVGESYLGGGGPLGSPDRALVLDTALEALIRISYRNTARGSLEELTRSWEDSQTALRVFREGLITRYMRKYPVAPGTPAAIKSHRPPGKEKKPPAGAKKKPKKKGARRKARAEEVEVVEVAPVLEVDELED